MKAAKSDSLNVVRSQLQNEAQQTFMWLALFSAGTAAVGRLKTAQAASEAIDEINLLTEAGTPANLPTGIEEILRTIKASNLLDATLFKQTLGSYGDDVLGSGVANKLLSTYNEFTEPARTAFRTEHGLVNDPDFWRKLNEEDAYLLDKWEDLWEQMITDRLVPDFLKERVLVDGILRYYSETLLRTALEQLDNPTRSEFLRSFGDTIQEVFDGFKNRPTKITEWANATSGEKDYLKKGTIWWHRCNLDLEDINRIQTEVATAMGTIGTKRKKRIPFLDPLTKEAAIRELPRICTIGNLTELSLIKYLRILSIQNPNRRFIRSVDVSFYSKNGKKKLGNFVEIDAIEIDVSKNEIVKIYSAKNKVGEGDWKVDIGRINNQFRNAPESKDAIPNFVKTNYSPDKPPGDELISQINEIKISFTELDGIESSSMSLTEFKSMLKGGYSFDDWEELNPTILNTNKSDLLEGMYEVIIKNLE